MAEKQLTDIRGSFVVSVSKAMLSQLLDDLLGEGILTDEEKDSILEENSSRADKARCLIDTVRRKGNEASLKMITHLQVRDPILYSKLVSCVEPAPPAKEKEEEEKQENDVYPVTKENISSRVALLITNITFTNAELNRHGADKDEVNMEKYLNSLGYEVVKHRNLTGQGIDHAVLKFSQHPKLKKTDSVWVVVMSHGELGAIFGVNWKKGDENPDHFKIDNIFKHLGSENCPALLNKPKIIIIQACRGEERGSALVSDSAQAARLLPDAEDDFMADAVRCVNKEKDFMAFLSCTPGTVSYRQPDLGSLLIQYIVDIFASFAKKDDIEELFRKVMRRFEDFSCGNKRQMATKDRCTLTKRFYLFPEKDLIRVRSRFVDKVSKPLLKQLLDDLLEDGLLNDAEKDYSSKVDMARALIDMVRKKGDRASRLMITHLEGRDPTLHSELGLSGGRPAQSAVPSWSSKLVTTTDAFWTEKQNDKNIYGVAEHSIRNRVALLITNRNFLNEKLNRHGAEKDEENMEKLLTSLRYEVVKHNDLTGKGIDEALIKFSKHPKLKETDSVFVVIMSHGKLGAVLGVNSKTEEPDEFPIDNIYKHLGTQECRALLNKPKVIVIQACRGEKSGSVLVSDTVACDDSSGSGTAHDENIASDVLLYAHKEKDFISLLSSTPDTLSYRQRTHGSFLIQYIVEVFNTFSHQDDIGELFRKVMQRFEECPLDNIRQMPTKDRCTLTKHFYLFPGH